MSDGSNLFFFYENFFNLFIEELLPDVKESKLFQQIGCNDEKIALMSKELLRTQFTVNNIMYLSVSIYGKLSMQFY